MGIRAQNAGGVQLVERRANGPEPADVDKLNQKLTGHAYASPSFCASGNMVSSC